METENPCRNLFETLTADHERCVTNMGDMADERRELIGQREDIDEKIAELDGRLAAEDATLQRIERYLAALTPPAQAEPQPAKRRDVQGAILAAIDHDSGMTEVGIVAATGLPLKSVRSAIKRLVERGDIACVGDGYFVESVRAEAAQ